MNFNTCWSIFQASGCVRQFRPFTSTRHRFTALQHAIERDQHNRAKSARAEIDFALQHEPMVDVILDAMAKGRIPDVSPTTTPNLTMSCWTC